MSIENKKCISCGKIHSLKTDICDKCGSVHFVPYQHNMTHKKISEIIEAKKEEKTEVKSEEKIETKRKSIAELKKEREDKKISG